mmetsp:Transcript_43706/g.114876  ORF Transcript_43706/g.114876 Transcript_43706/m.114876 type:complete len:358 (+) Transcript_43706:1-1074(+)
MRPSVAPASQHGYDEDAALSGLLEVEASAARREHVFALLREYEQLQALSPAEASGWQQRRERAAACLVQTAWRRRTSRRAFMTVVHHSGVQRRTKAATTIQRAQRTRQRMVAESAPSISRAEVAALQHEVVEATLARAREMRAAREARDEWRDAGHDITKEEPPPLPEWVTAPSWARDLEAKRAGGSALTHELRASAQRGLASGVTDQAQILRSVHEWPDLRAKMQAAAVRQQVVRTQAAALFAQLRHPPELPPPPRVRASASSVEATLPPVLPSKPKVLKEHQRALRNAKLTLEQEEGPIMTDPRKTRERGAWISRDGAPSSPSAAQELGDRMASLPGGAMLSAAELLWLSSLEVA